MVGTLVGGGDLDLTFDLAVVTLNLSGLYLRNRKVQEVET